MLELSETLHEINRRLQAGDPGIGWRGDFNLSLQIGQLRTPAGTLVAERLEVWRHCEDGIDRIIGWWEIEDWQKILPDIKLMDPRSPAHVPSIERVDSVNLAKEYHNDTKMAEAQQALQQRLEYEYARGKLT